MKHQITSVAVSQAGKLVALLYFTVTCLGIPIGIGLLLMGGKDRGLGLVFVFVPLLYLGVGYIYGALFALIYNLVASRFGGLEITIRAIQE